MISMPKEDWKLWPVLSSDRAIILSKYSHKYPLAYLGAVSLTHCRETHICVGTNTNTGSDNGLSPGRRQAIIWTNAEILLIGLLATNFSEILIKILTFAFRIMRLKVSSAKCRPSCLRLNVLRLMMSQFQSIKSQRKMKVSKMHILRYMASKFRVKCQRYPLKFHTQFWTHTPQKMHFTRHYKFYNLYLRVMTS